MKFLKTPEDLVTYILNAPEKSCPKCGLTNIEFDKEGRFGCPECYEFFAEEVKKYVLPYHKANQHVGKRPKIIKQSHESPEEEIKYLKLKLALAVEHENYSEAAKLKKQLDELGGQHGHLP